MERNAMKLYMQPFHYLKKTNMPKLSEWKKKQITKQKLKEARQMMNQVWMLRTVNLVIMLGLLSVMAWQLNNLTCY